MEDDQHKSNRELTYHVGWKKGKILSPGHKQMSPAPAEAGFSPAIQRLVHKFEAVMWTQAPFLPDRVWLYAVLLLPAVGLAASVILVIFMMQAA